MPLEQEASAETQKPEDPKKNELTKELEGIKAQNTEKLEVQKQQQQLDFINSINEADLPLYLDGGYAEEALLSSEVTRPHGDVDVLLRRGNVETVIPSLEERGYSCQPIIESGSDKPYKYLVSKGELLVDVGMVDQTTEGDDYIDVAGAEGKRYRFTFPKDTFSQAESNLNGRKVKTISPLAVMHMRNAVSQIARFETSRQKDIDGEKAMREAYFPGSESNDQRFKARVQQIG